MSDQTPEASALALDRKRFIAHTVTFLASFGIYVLGFLLGAAQVLPWVATLGTWVLAGISMVLSGVFALRIRRTWLSGPFRGLRGPNPYGDDADALTTPGLWSGDLSPGYAEATGPIAILIMGILLTAASIWVLIGAV